MKSTILNYVAAIITIVAAGSASASAQYDEYVTGYGLPEANNQEYVAIPASPTFVDPGYQTPFTAVSDNRIAQNNSTVVAQPKVETIPQPITTNYTPINGQPGGQFQPAGQLNTGGYGLYDQGYGRSGFITGFSFVFLKPQYENNNAFITTRAVGGGSTDHNREFDWDYELSPRVWVELVGNSDLGARVAYWQYDHGSNAESNTTSAAPEGWTSRDLGTTNGSFSSAVLGDRIDTKSSLIMHTIDAEMTQRLKFQNWQAMVGGGFRHAAIHQKYRAIGSNGGTRFASSRSSHRFDGIGPTVFAELRRPFGGSGLSLIASARGSLLFGDSKLNSLDREAGVTSRLTTSNGQSIPVGEIQVGGEWSVWLSSMTVFYVQVAWEAQQWAGAGNASSRDDDLGLYGFNTTVGLEW